MKNKILIIDGNNMLYRAYYKFGNLRGAHGPSGLVYGFPYILSSLIKLQSPDDVIVVFDGARDKKRTDIWPNYKKREKGLRFDGEDFFRQKQEVVKILITLGIKIVEQPYKEADDIIWVLTKRLKVKNQIVIVSSDKDFNQLISNKVSIWNPKGKKDKGIRLTHKNLEKEVGYKPEQCVDYLILDGDKSDNIPGMPGMGVASIRDFFSKYDSISEYLISSDKELNKLPKQRLEDVFLRNRKLIDIRRFCRNYISIKDITIRIPKKGKINRKELGFISSNHDISTFTKDEFIQTFEKLLIKNKNNKLCLKYLSQAQVELVKPH